jgi:hypothetical protein
MMWATGKYWPSDASLYSIIIADVTEEPLVLHLLDTNDHYSSLIKLCKFEGRGNSSYEGLI